jgi:hypothetical protein
VFLILEISDIFIFIPEMVDYQKKIFPFFCLESEGLVAIVFMSNEGRGLSVSISICLVNPHVFNVILFLASVVLHIPRSRDTLY